MPFFGNLIKSLLTIDSSTTSDEIIEVQTSSYMKLQIVCRDECMVLYGPTSSKKFEMILNRPLESSRTSSAFSLFQLSDCKEAKCQFEQLAGALVPLVQAMPHIILQKKILQDVCSTVNSFPSWKSPHIAAHFGYVDAFALPIFKRDLDKPDCINLQTPLHIAVEGGNLKTVSALLALGASTDSIDKNGNSMYHLCAASSLPLLKMMISCESKLLNHVNLAGKSPLHLACENNKPECVKELLCAGADVNIAATHDRCLPIHSAMQSDSTLCAKEIIKSHPNQLNAEDMRDAGTPLHWAKSAKMISALIELGCRVDARNNKQRTALHNMAEKGSLSCALILLSNEASVNLRDVQGNTPLHLAATTVMMQALLVFEADPSILNKKGESARHTIATSTAEEQENMLYCLNVVGAQRCRDRLPDCHVGCAPGETFDGVTATPSTVIRERADYDTFLHTMLKESLVKPRGSRGRVLCLDGGGIKGLVLIQLLMALQSYTNTPVIELFDWVCGTSTGGVLALALAMGKKLPECRNLYFKLKEQVFVGQRPYCEKTLQSVFQDVFGATTVMSDITGINVAVTAVLGDRFPADLHIFRNYESGQSLFEAANDKREPFKSTDLVWEAARASSAAPTYFRPHKRYVDGGLIANNPTLDMLTEIYEHNTVLKSLGREKSAKPIRTVVSLGVGKPPVSEVQTFDISRPAGILDTINAARGLSSLTSLLIDQTTMCDNQTVDRARAWCGMCGIEYHRLTPQMTADVPLNETQDATLVDLLWQTVQYIHTIKPQIQQLVQELSN